MYQFLKELDKTLLICVESNFNQKNVKIDDTNDISSQNESCNLVEYKKLIEGKRKRANSIPRYDDEKTNKPEEQIRPQLNKKEENFIIYKKQNMINEIEEISKKYYNQLQNINNLNIQLLDEYGRILDLNNTDYSFCLTLQSSYDI